MKRLTRGLLTATAVMTVCAMWSCSSRGEQAAVKEEAAQIEEARMAGRNAAKEFIGRRWQDSLELQERLVEAGTKRNQYDSLPRCREAYDSTFIETIRTVDPSVARQLEHYRQ